MMINKLLVILCGILFITQQLSAQQFQEVLYLKNGSVIKGVVMEQNTNSSVKIKTQDGNIFVYPMSEVDKVTKEEILKRVRRQRNSSADVENARGYKGFVDLGGTIGIGHYGDGVVSVSTTHGFQFNPYLFLGAGMAVEYHNFYGATFLPIFIESRLNFIDNSITPFFALRAGYSVYTKGVYFNPNLGVNLKVSPNIGMNVSVGYTLQQATLYAYSPLYYYHHNVNISGLSLKLGFEF